MAKTHEWREGFRLSQLDPVEVGKELDKLRNRNGDIDIDEVWQTARDPQSAMYNGFTWDKDAAALKCWRIEARYIVRHIKVLHDRGPLKGVSIRAYVSPSNTGYRGIENTLKAKDSRDKLVESVLNRYLALKEVYQFVEELARVHEAIDTAVSERKKKQVKKKKATSRKAKRKSSSSKRPEQRT